MKPAPLSERFNFGCILSLCMGSVNAFFLKKQEFCAESKNFFKKFCMACHIVIGNYRELFPPNIVFMDKTGSTKGGQLRETDAGGLLCRPFPGGLCLRVPGFPLSGAERGAVRAFAGL